ncbi:YlxM family DNA-binding protein [Heliophilum fasciatum]|uniref:UPF0122 protein EDD73_11614 n=1 Tax=Heliophilum fasciatum TaxID=35700 RepID=A0A4R2RIP7_9FIRM|nr:YlxM family DNA-binding protein [Heliophilum fasciatum]MCW2278431.1 putative DNA-binding protein YlxM (UPF0122 family) [Heliophilum fasciatum]TCP63670.1 hypothetical protein EDD73_11614 [Heliophilum fasciatum]
MHSLEKLQQMALLLDFYGQLLTERQRMALAYYYEDNLSLAEIAEELNVSRQAVFDVIRRAEKILLSYEERLALIERWQTERNVLLQVEKLLRGSAAWQHDTDVMEAGRLLEELMREGGTLHGDV